MKITVLFSYTENVIPPGCRKPRLVEFQDGVLEFEIPEVTATDAPIAIKTVGVRNFAIPSEKFHVDYRWFDGKLWTAVSLWNGVPRGYTSRHDDWEHRQLPEQVDSRCSTAYYYGLFVSGGHTRCEMEAKLKESLANNLIVDGVRYREAGEPRYVIGLFGLGRNHGGTDVFVESSYNNNLGHQRYFNLLDRDKALATATEIATKRGDTESLPMHINRSMEFQILIPEAIQVNPATQHGDGDAFLNTLEGITETSCDNATAGALTMAAALASL